MAKCRIINEAPGARGIDGILVDAGKTLDGVELTSEQIERAKRLPGLTIEPATPDKKSTAKSHG